MGVRRFGWLAVLLCGVLVATTVRAEDPEVETERSVEDDELFDELELLQDEAVVELPARHRQALGMSPSAVTVITREDIETSGAYTIPDLLRQVPGMDVVVVSSFFTALSARLPWTYENLPFLVLIDGREANLDLMGQAPWEVQPIGLDDIERIEIIRGPGSALYGANAFGGVIAITTRVVPEQAQGSARVMGGEVGFYQVAARAAARLGSVGLSLHAGADRAALFLAPDELAKQVWRTRAVADWSPAPDHRLLLEGSLSRGTGPVATGVGEVRGPFLLGVVRLAYESEDIRAQLYWDRVAIDATLGSPLELHGVRFAEFSRIRTISHVVDGQVQWTLPTFWEPLLLIAGAGVRANSLASDELLDAETFADLDSPRYHQLGVDHWEARTGAFLHAEVSPVSWLTATAGVRADYNTETGFFPSPRLALVAQPIEHHFLRAGVALAYRKPSFLEQLMHPSATFPADSPIQGENQVLFQEFLTRVVGYSELDSERLLSVELGYLGQLLEGRLQLGLDLFYSRNSNLTEMVSHVVEDALGLPDLRLSTFQFETSEYPISIAGGELSLRFSPARGQSLFFSWAHRQVYEHESGTWVDTTPKNLFVLGWRAWQERGLLGSLVASVRSRVRDNAVDNPDGLLAPYLEQRLPDELVLVGRLGWRFDGPGGLSLEAGLQGQLPISLGEGGPRWRVFERGGGITPEGVRYGGDALDRRLALYLQGSI